MLLGSALLAALGSAAMNTGFQARQDGAGLAVTELFLQLVLGDFIGILVLAVPLLALSEGRPPSALVRRWSVDALLVLLPTLLVSATAVYLLDGSASFFAAALCALPILVISMRSGWRGVAFAFPLVSLAAAMASFRHGNAPSAIQMQLFLALVGVSGLLLGASVDELNARNAALAAGKARLDALAEQLRGAALRNLTLSEDLRRWLASELHDELGQNLTALQTRIRLAHRSVGDASVLVPLDGIVQHMRGVVSGLMGSLRPAGLDAFGLESSLRNGSIRDLVEAGGMDYRLVIDDPIGALPCLDDGTRTAVYRIVQEAATNAVRHAGARVLDVRVRTRRWRAGVRVSVSVADDGRGIDPASPRLNGAGLGLQGIRDRTLVLDGRMRVRSRPSGTAVIAVFPALPATSARDDIDAVPSACGSAAMTAGE